MIKTNLSITQTTSPIKYQHNTNEVFCTTPIIVVLKLEPRQQSHVHGITIMKKKIECGSEFMHRLEHFSNITLYELPSVNLL